jgi:hypothetical protein
MADKARKAAKLKLIMGITIPVFIMITSLIMVGVSFAWFSDSAEVNIATINLTTKEVFTLDFSVGASDTTPYNGQKSLGDDNYLRTQYRNITQVKPETYMRDAPFSFKTTIGLSTEGIPVDMEMHFNFTQIIQQDGSFDGEGQFLPSGDPYDMIIYGGTSTNDKTVHPVAEYDIGKIPFAFTWYFVESGRTLENATTVYTPYGIIDLVSPTGAGDVALGYRQASTLNGVAVTNETSIASLASPAGLKNFSANKTDGVNKIFDFYVVFAPEKLFWMQFFPADRDVAYTTLYNSSELANYITPASGDRMYYAATSYTGATFYFTAEINVTEVHWPTEG